MRISVITPSFNMASLLSETIESVLSNLRAGDEYFVIDGGSSDGSVDILRKYASSFSGWTSEADRGYSDALRKGFSRATGDILCWINAGDLLLPGALDAARHAFEQSDADLIFGDDFYIDEESRVILFSCGHVRDLRVAMLFGAWTPLQDACFWRRTLYERVGGIDPTLKHAADYDLFLRMAIASRAVHVPLAFSAFRRHQGQKSIAGAALYRAERISVRQRELQRLRVPAWQRWLACAVQWLAVRWRVRVSQRRWTRPDLAGRQITDMRCARYWPVPGAQK
jgi:glycosyltransferase involved in cell wall biosynthesis